MIWVLLIVAVVAILYFKSKNTNASTSSSQTTTHNSASNNQVPTRLSGIHPDVNSFWHTEEFYARLGEECAKITDNKLSMSLNVQPSGTFSVYCSFIDSARVFFPTLESDLHSNFTGNDSQINSFHYITQKFAEIIQDDAPSAQIDAFDGIDGKSFSVVWNPNGLP